jgi:non-ribosomal peptide synthetase component F
MDFDSNRESAYPSGSSPEESDEVTAFPLSPAQFKIWETTRADPRGTTYNGSFRMNLAGPVDTVLLERSLKQIVDRHEILRASVELLDREPTQIIAPVLPLRLQTFDLRESPGEHREAQMDRLCMDEAQRPFDLANGPLIRAGLIRMEDQRYILMLTIHQMICDGWSIGLIMEELQKIYAALADGRAPLLPSLSLQFGDFVIWQKDLANSPKCAQQLNYWKNKLRGYRRNELAFDYPQADRTATSAAIVSQLLPRELTDKLRDFSTQQGATFFITTLAACLTLLYRYTGEYDLSAGSPLAGRNTTELESLVGQFVNHVIFRADASGDPPFSQFLTSVRDSVWEALANQDVPFESVLQAVRPVLDSAHDPAYVINFICQREYGRASTFNFDFAGVRMSTMPSKSQGALYDLNFFLVEREVGWRLSLEYKTGLFEEATAKSLLDHFRELLEQVVVNPDSRLSEYSLSGESPRVQASNEKIAASKSSDAPFLAPGEVFAMPASIVQQRFFLLASLDPRSASFNMPACVRIAGPLSRVALEKSFQFLVDRHETLRTTFEEIDDEIVQIVSPPRPFQLSFTDLSSVSSSEREASLQSKVLESAELPFNLEKGPLFRAHLFRLDADHHVLVTVTHHILTDGWSNRVAQDDLWASYAAFSEGRRPQLAPLPLQYSDFSTWQKDWLACPEAQQHTDYWLKQLHGTLPVTNFPLDHQPSSKSAPRGAIETNLLSADLAAALKSFSQSRNVTMFMLMLSAFGALLSRHSGQTDILVGSPVANRRTETELLIGPFSGPLCLRLDLSGQPTFQELLGRVRDVTLDALGHTDLPFEVLIDHLKAPLQRGRKPLFQFYFFYQSAFLKPRHIGSLTITPMPTFSTGTPFEMQLGIIEREEGIRAQLEYNAALYNPETIRKVLEDWVSILRTAVASPELRMDSIA